jgi:hypothetical protein
MDTKKDLIFEHLSDIHLGLRQASIALASLLTQDKSLAHMFSQKRDPYELMKDWDEIGDRVLNVSYRRELEAMGVLKRMKRKKGLSHESP